MADETTLRRMIYAATAIAIGVAALWALLLTGLSYVNDELSESTRFRRVTSGEI